MGLFSKKKKTRSSDSGEYDMFDIVGGTEENLSANQYPELSYDDMGDFDIPDEDQKRDTPKNKEGGSGFRRMIIAGTVLALGIIGAIYFTGDTGSDTEASEQQEEQQEPATDATQPQGDSDSSEVQLKKKDSGVVATEQIGQEYTTSDDGNPINGTGAIMAFDHAYYSKRDGQAARDMFNPKADAYSADYIQRAIDKVPQGTTYSLAITPVRIGEEYKVELSLNLPGSEEPTT